MDDDFGDDEDFGLGSFGDEAQPAEPQATATTASIALGNIEDRSSQPQRGQSNAWSEAGASDFDLYGDMHDDPFASGTSVGLAPQSSALPAPAPQRLKQPSLQAALSDTAPGGSAVVNAPVRDASTGSAVFIGNLQWWTTDAEVEAACAAFGQVSLVQFTEDKSNGRSKGYARVHFSDAAAASLCKTGLNGRVLNEKACVVTLAGPGPPPASSAPGPTGHSAATSSAAGGGFPRAVPNPGRGGPPPPAPPSFPPARGQGMISGGRPPDMFRPPLVGHNQLMTNGLGQPTMGRGPGMGMAMGRGGPMGGMPPGMMPRGFPANMQAGMMPPGGMHSGIMGGPVMSAGMMRPPFGSPGGMPSLFTGGAPLSAGMPSWEDDHTSKRKRI